MTAAFDPVLAAVRFGTGLSPRHPLPAGTAELIACLGGPDDMARRFPIPGVAEVTPTLADLRQMNRDLRDARGSPDEAGQVERLNQARRAARLTGMRNLISTVVRGAEAPNGLRERLTLFWADHFTVRARTGQTRHVVTPFVEDAIRPHLAGRFADMLFAATTHPMMIDYLDQRVSVGPESVYGLRTGRGLNENLAREVLELHTLGVEGPYSQTDVTEFAQLLTGLSWTYDTPVEYRRNWAEPGPETVLGQQFSAEATLDTIREALSALAIHPSTGRHLATKLAVHFVSDTPDPAFVDRLADAYMTSGGHLGALVIALVTDPAAWVPERTKVRWPVEFMMATLRALDVPADPLLEMGMQALKRGFEKPMLSMGQRWEQPAGPDGWPDAASRWINAQGLAGRIEWAMTAPSTLLGDLPDPREFAVTALGPVVPPEVAFAASAAEHRAAGIGLVLSSAAFQRR